MANEIPAQSNDYVADGSVVSKYSPAAYLQSLWEKAITLHDENNRNSLVSRRPDLKDLPITQDSMDTPVSTLSLSNTLLTNLCKQDAATNTDALLMQALAKDEAAEYYHQPVETLRNLITGLADDPFSFLDSDTANCIYSGMLPGSNVENAGQLAQVWAITHLYGAVEEEARVMCGLDISQVPVKDEATGVETPSQINRLFGVSTNDLPVFTTDTEVEKTLMQVFGINNTELNLLASLTKTELQTKITVNQVSALYGWVLLSRSLGGTIAELVILYQQLTEKSDVWMLYTTFKTILDWMDERKITVAGLLLLINTYSYDKTPAMATLMQELKREVKATDGLTKTTLAGAVASAFNLSSANQIEGVINWLDADTTPDNGMVSKDFMDTFVGAYPVEPLIPFKNVRTIIIVGSFDFINLQEIQVIVNGINVASDAVITSNLSNIPAGYALENLVDGKPTTSFYSGITRDAQGDIQEFNAWISIDLRKNFSIDKIIISPNTTPIIGADPLEVAADMVRYSFYASDYVMSADSINIAANSADWDGLIGGTRLGTVTVNSDSGDKTLSYSSTPSIMSQGADYINSLLQRALVASALGLTSDILAMLSITADGVAQRGTLPFTLDRLQTLSQLQVLVSRCGSSAPALLAQLSANALQVSLFAQYLNVDPESLTTSKLTDTLTFASANDILKTYLFAQKQGISLINMTSFRELRNTDQFAIWASVADALMAELPPARFKALQQKREEGLSKALSLYCCANNLLFKGMGIDELSSYLLTDLQTSGQSQTSQLAWAVASIQLYIERCLNGEEDGVIDVAKNGQFFEDWDRYNGRYSQWAGLAQLLYEPENYIDPSLRLKATESFNNLQQQLTSGPLNEDAAENAFYSYLTDFEEMAEIVTVNAYHDTDDYTSGTTWFIGQTRGAPTHWYWRSVDHSKLTAQAGAVQAWSGWSKIDIPITPVSSDTSLLIRPVVFNNRLYVAWLEERDKQVPPATAGATPADSSAKPVKTKECIFKLAHQSYDGSWSMPAETVLALGENAQKAFSVGTYTDLLMYITVDELVNEIRLFVGLSYDPSDNLALSPEWYVSDHAIVQSIGSERIFNSTTVRQAHNAIITGNSSKQIVAAYPYSSGAKDPTHLSVGASVSTAKDPNEKIPGMFTFSGATKGDFISSSSVFSFDTVVFGSFNVDDAGRITGFINGGIGGGYSVSATGTISLEGITPKPVDLSDCITITKDTYSPERWTINFDSTQNYALSSNFPAQLLKLTVQGTDAVFALTDLRTNTANLSKLLDFEGALGCYYWELFYHVPVLISLQLQQAQDYLGAAKWLGYVYDPNAALKWKPLPLLNDTTWGPFNTQTTDPDVIAESDPMHYKVATLMRLLDLLIARGDTAYRIQERDTLVEAQMWYLRAMSLLGEPSDLSTETSPSSTTLSQVTAGYFKPQENVKFNGYWLLLGQRLFNLRHNLTLDGQPLNLPLFAKPANPGDLLSAELAASSDAPDLQTADNIGLLRFKPALEQARGMAGQLVQFGSTLLGIAERQDGEAMSQLLQTQASQLMSITCNIQDSTLAALDGDLAALQAQYDGVTLRKTYYNTLYDENISAIEMSALGLNATAAGLLVAGGASSVVGGALDTAVPNIFGFSDGGNRWGGVCNGVSSLLTNTAFALTTTAGALTEADSYRRRRAEWKQQMDSADSELAQLDKQRTALQTRREAASMQKNYLFTQQRQSGEQLQFLKSKFTNQQLFSWMRSRMSTIFWQFYDITLGASLRVQQALNFEMGDKQTFIRTGAWQNNNAGLLCGESLLIDLAQMEATWQAWDKRTLEVTRTVSLASILTADKEKGTPELTDAIARLLSSSSGPGTTWSVGTEGNSLTHKVQIGVGGMLDCEINLAALNIPADYPDSLGAVRRIKNISISLPALVGPYQNIQAVLAYTEAGMSLPAGCNTIAVSHGVNDSGLFQLDFNDSRYLPFEGVALKAPNDNNGALLTLSFPNFATTQKAMLASLNDIILHIRYTIRN